MYYWEEAAEYEVVVNAGFTELKESAYAYSVSDSPLSFPASPKDKSNMARYLFTGFSRCLYREQKFHSEAERILAVILDRDSIKWFRPAKGQFLIFYGYGADHPEYQPDFVAETAETIFMIEPKAANQMDDPVVQAKKEAAVKWCGHASSHARSYNGKPWRYLLIPHHEIAENMTVDALDERFGFEWPSRGNG